MSDRIEIKPTEHGVVRVFTVDLTPDQVEAFNRRNGNWPLQQALGAEALNPDHVELFPLSDLDELGLSGYLEQGHGIPVAELAGMRARLDGLAGHVLIVTSRAFDGQAQVLTPRAPLHLIASFNEETAPVSFDPLPSEAARGTTGDKPGPNDAAMSGRIASLALLVLFLLVAVVIWIAS
ncbi:hypothetical protein SAMN05444398_10977 [Roseovarius pacificus]|uniref:Aspartate carbamoyltransferase catalytic subunit n=1 Tax=Roseovarius pacificus TaxID=337701 RepID=A0A1M7FPZ7_9RHOB|nr:hypothetical protein [Roseovarius pacificus]GGO59316.1 hypothetical protein GCM10011315_31020 [Roseovarius pacificus]SHM06035.1 hypothetical protein SAMN05444398_10977 [Roseovarius pacificus]